jgi:phage gp36-like protein
MPYATRADIEQSRGASFLATIVPPDVSVDVATAAALAAATGTIDLYLAKRYPLPLAVVPVGIRKIAIDLACYELASTHSRLTEDIQARAAAGMKVLKDIGAGVAALGEADPRAGGLDPAPGQEGITSDDAASFSARPRQFGRGRPAP